MKKHLHSKEGQVVVLLALVLVILLALTGLAIDVGIAYVVKAKMSAAVDAAAIAAGKVVSQGTSAMDAEAKKLFDANFPAGSLGVTVQDPTTSIVPKADGTWSINVNVTALSPAYFAKVVGVPGFTVQAAATINRTVDLVLVLDCSGSISGNLPALQAAAVNFVSYFNPLNDRFGLIHFGDGAVEDVAITSDRGFNQTAITSLINGLRVGGGTTSEEAMRMAQAQLDSIPSTSQSSLRVIVFFTDGAPNGFVGLFPPPGSPPLALYGGPYMQNGVDNLTFCKCAAGCQNILTGNSSRIGDARAFATYTYNLQTSPEVDFCGINRLLPTDYTGTVNLASYNNMRTLSTEGSSGRVINTRCNVNMAARNMVENVANAARSEDNPIHIFTIGFGAATGVEMAAECGYGSNESGTNILMRLANVKNSDTYNKDQPPGFFTLAGTPEQLKSAFSKVASRILRITR